MTTTSFPVSAVGTVADDAAFRNYGNGISTGLAAIGFVKTSDTGQINWATVTKPVSAGLQAGYEVWRFNDSLQATAPIFVRIGYGTSSVATQFSLWLTVGKGSDGAGNITGTILAQTQVPYSGATASASSVLLSSADGSTLIVVFTPNMSAFGPVIIIERSRSAAGAPTATGLMIVTKTSTSTIPAVRGCNHAAASSLTQQGAPVATPINSPMAAAGNAPVFPATIIDGSGNAWQPRSFVVGNTNDLGTSLIVVPTWGSYLPTLDGNWGPTTTVSSNNAAAFAWS